MPQRKARQCQGKAGRGAAIAGLSGPDLAQGGSLDPAAQRLVEPGRSRR